MRQRFLFTFLGLFSMHILYAIPIITDITDNFGPSIGSNPSRTTIHGSEFIGATSATFGGTSVPFSVVDDSTITLALAGMRTTTLPAVGSYGNTSNASLTFHSIELSNNAIDTKPGFPIRLGPVPKFIMPRFEIISRAGCDERVGAILKILPLSAEPRSSQPARKELESR